MSQNVRHPPLVTSVALHIEGLSSGRLLFSKSLHMRLGRLAVGDVYIHFGSPIEEKVSGLEGCYVANPYI